MGDYYVCVSLFGQWVRLDSNDTIDGYLADDWVSRNLKFNRIPDKYLNVCYQGNNYTVHPSQIMLSNQN